MKTDSSPGHFLQDRRDLHWKTRARKVTDPFPQQREGCTSRAPLFPTLTETTCTTSLLPEKQLQVQEKVSHLIADLPDELKEKNSDFLLLKPLFHSYKIHSERFGTIKPQTTLN